MTTSFSSALRQLGAATRLLVVLTIALGVLYPLALTLVGRAFPGPTDGSLIRVNGQVVGSSLLGQSAATDPRWFQGRPSASEADGTTSGGSNLGASSSELKDQVAQRRQQLRTANPDAPDEIPADALTASASGLDPHISPAYAAWQAPRVAKATGLSLPEVTALIEQHTSGRTAGVLGAPRVNVTTLNVALASATMGP